MTDFSCLLGRKLIHFEIARDGGSCLFLFEDGHQERFSAPKIDSLNPQRSGQPVPTWRPSPPSAPVVVAAYERIDGAQGIPVVCIGTSNPDRCFTFAYYNTAEMTRIDPSPIDQ